jgi:hypothetical protein
MLVQRSRNAGNSRQNAPFDLHREPWQSNAVGILSDARKSIVSKPMPLLVKFMLRHALIGVGAAIIFVAAVLALDVGGLATLIGTSSSGILAVVLLTFFTGLTFGSLQMAFAVMSLKEKEETPRDDKPTGNAALEPVPVRVARRP